MTIHLTAIHACDHFRADVRANLSRVRKLTEELRDEVEHTRPRLRWPLQPRAPDTPNR
jgi:hypothetical protein